jgi:hypothetical protein
MFGDAAGAVQDPRTPVVLQAVRFAFALPELEWFILEQVPALEYMWECCLWPSLKRVDPQCEPDSYLLQSDSP